MRRPPSVLELRSYPVTASTAGLAILASVWHLGLHRDPSSLLLETGMLGREPWRLVTSTLPHAHWFHLIFNLYWLWALGTAVEREWGRVRTLGVLVLCAVGSSAAQFAVSVGGLGLSGVVYGLFGVLWMVRSRNRETFGVIDRPTIRIFVAWFLLCIVMTRWGGWNVGNTAHGVGALIGIVLGKAVIEERSRRWLWAAAMVVMLGVVGVASTVGRPYVNVYRSEAWFLAELASAALKGDEPGRAVDLYRQALEKDPEQVSWWYMLGRSYERLGVRDDAEEAFARAWGLDPGDPTVREALLGLRVAHARRLGNAKKYEEAARRYARAQEVDPGNAGVAYEHGRMLEYARRHDEAFERFQRAVELDGESAAYREALAGARSRRGRGSPGKGGE